ncbi:MAG: hypothetical protein EXR99_05660 [Gemmataceae bacterium]|nr:hypothetical protein [Gemmataceae bacterium]
MGITTPDWLSKRNAKLEASKDGQSWLVFFGSELAYVVALAPAKGKFTTKVMETINGKQIPQAEVFENAEDAVRAGLEKLRGALGW